jgi:hypothetical protein
MTGLPRDQHPSAVPHQPRRRAYRIGTSVRPTMLEASRSSDTEQINNCHDSHASVRIGESYSHGQTGLSWNCPLGRKPPRVLSDGLDSLEGNCMGLQPDGGRGNAALCHGAVQLFLVGCVVEVIKSQPRHGLVQRVKKYRATKRRELRSNLMFPSGYESNDALIINPGRIISPRIVGRCTAGSISLQQLGRNLNRPTLHHLENAAHPELSCLASRFWDGVSDELTRGSTNLSAR